MKRRALLAFFITLILAVPHWLPAQPLTLPDAVQIALRNNERVKQYQEKLKQKQFADREAWGNFLPSITLQAGYNHMNNPLSIDLNPIREAMLQLHTADQVTMANLQSLITAGRPLTPEEQAAAQRLAYGTLDRQLPAFTETFKEQDFKTATLVGVQPLFLGGKLIAAKKFAAAEEMAARADYQRIRNEVIRETIRNYLTVVLLNNVVHTRQDVLNGMLRHQRDARKLFDEGLIARYQLLRAKVAVADARRKLFDDRNKRELALTALRHTLGLPEDEPLAVRDSLIYHPVTDTLTVFRQQAMADQPMLRLISYKRKAAAQKLVAERAEFLPQIAGFGKYELYPQYLSSLEPRWIVGIQVNFNLFNGFKRYQRLQAARHLKKEVGYLEADAHRQVDLWVQKSWREMRNAQQSYLRASADLALARENVRLNEKRFHTGLGTSLEVIDARLMLEKNEIERLRDLYHYYLAMSDLYLATGHPENMLKIWQN